MNLKRNGSSASPELPSEAMISRPVLQPSESIPPQGIYIVKGKNDQDNGVGFIHLQTIYLFANVSVCFVHRDLRADLSERGTLHQSYHGSGVHHHRAEGQRGTCVHGLVLQHVVHNMCVSVSIRVGEGVTCPFDHSKLSRKKLSALC